MLPGLVAFLQTLSAAEAPRRRDSPQQGTTTLEWFVTKAAALLTDGHTPDSVAAAIITGNHELLRPARSNVERVLRFGNRHELRAGFTLFAWAYEGDRRVKRVSRAYGGERIDFHNGTSILFHVGPGCLWPLACDYRAPCPGCQPHPEKLMRPSIVTFLETILTAEAERQRNPSAQWHDKDCEAVPDVLYPDLEPGACTCGVPEQVLADIEARRALLDEHQDVNDGNCGTCVNGNWGYPTHGSSSPQTHPCRTLRLLAQPYANRRGYNGTWRLPDDERTVTVRLDNHDARFVPSHPLTPLMSHDDPMTTYDGPATVIADGTEYEVTAQLAITRTSGGLSEWHGSLETEDDATAWQIQEARTATLRIGQDREGSFIAVRLEVGSTGLDIQGSGPAPFGP